MAMALSSSLSSPLVLTKTHSSSSSAKLVPPNPLLHFPTKSTALSSLSSSGKFDWRLNISFFSSFLAKKGKDATALKEELLDAIAPLDRGAEASPEDQQIVDQVFFFFFHSFLGS